MITLAALAKLAGDHPQALAAPVAPIRIGEINSYTAIPAFTQPYRLGWQLAVEQVNAVQALAA